MKKIQTSPTYIGPGHVFPEKKQESATKSPKAEQHPEIHFG